ASHLPADLYFFPTRRSSDLHLQVDDAILHAGTLQHLQEQRLPVIRRAACLYADFSQAALQARNMRLHAERLAAIHGHHLVDAVRSEEHTSELQSRENLVCRL